MCLSQNPTNMGNRRYSVKRPQWGCIPTPESQLSISPALRGGEGNSGRFFREATLLCSKAVIEHVYGFCHQINLLLKKSCNLYEKPTVQVRPVKEVLLKVQDDQEQCQEPRGDGKANFETTFIYYRVKPLGRHVSQYCFGLPSPQIPLFCALWLLALPEFRSRVPAGFVVGNDRGSTGGLEFSMYPLSAKSSAW